MAKINIDIDVLVKEFLTEGESCRSLAKKYNVEKSTIVRMLKKNGNEKVINKIKSNFERTRIKKLNTIYIEDNLIKVVASKTNNIFIFDNDDEIYNILKSYTWFEDYGGHLYTNVDNKKYYAYWFVLGKPQSNELIDHINRDTKDNRRNNLRFASHAQNIINTKINKNNKTGYNGVCYEKRSGKYRAYIGINKKCIRLGIFKTPEEAYFVRAKKEIEIYGEFANIHEDFKYLLEECKGDKNEI